MIKRQKKKWVRISITLNTSLHIWFIITSSAVGIKICTITTGIIKYKSITKKESKKHCKIVLLAKAKLDKIKVSITKALIDSFINHDM